MLATDFAPHVEITQGHAAVLPARTKSRDTLAEHLVGGLSRTINAREHIFREGDAATHVYKVDAGHVCIYRMVADGRRQVMDFAYPGDIIGLGAFAVHGANAQATSKTRIRCVPISMLHELVRLDQAVGLKVYEAMSLELQATRELLFTVSQRTAAERVAAFLVALSRRNERRGEDAHEIVLPMTRADIADYLGLTIETVSRTFTKFRVEGHIELEQCILVTLLDLPALSALADGTCPMATRN